MQDTFQEEYKKFKWEKYKYNSENIKSSIEPITKCKDDCIKKECGVYIIYAPCLLSRVNGSSNVVYIGSTAQQTMKDRLTGTRSDTILREKIESPFPNQVFTIECYFAEKKDKPKKENLEYIETKLLIAYWERYYELPPANCEKGKACLWNNMRSVQK